MLIAVITDGSELSNYSLVKMLNSASKSWDTKALVFIIKLRGGKKSESYNERLVDRAKALGVEATFEEIEEDSEAAISKEICKRSGVAGATGIFVPEGLSGLYERLKTECGDIPVEKVSSAYFRAFGSS
jgi:hypothetical protein